MPKSLSISGASTRLISLQRLPILSPATNPDISLASIVKGRTSWMQFESDIVQVQFFSARQSRSCFQIILTILIALVSNQIALHSFIHFPIFSEEKSSLTTSSEGHHLHHDSCSIFCNFSFEMLRIIVR